MSVFVERRCKAEDPRTKTSRKKRPFVERQIKGVNSAPVAFAGLQMEFE